MGEDTVGIAVEVSCRETKKGSPMWSFLLTTGQTANMFDSQLPSLKDAGYYEVVNMSPGDKMSWATYPIELRLVRNGKWLNIEGVAPRSIDAIPDPYLTFQRNSRCESAQSQINMLLERPDGEVVVFDFETSGVTEHDVILSGAVIALHSGVSLLDDNNVFICPDDMSRVELATHVHGLTVDFIKDKPKFPEVYGQLWSALNGKVWIAYNVAFDHRMIDLMCARFDLDPIAPLATVDAMELYGKYKMDWTDKVNAWDKVKLTEAVEQMGIEVKDAHDAYGDIVMTRELLLSMVK